MSDPEIIEMLSRCSHWIGEKLQDYKIERGPGGILRIWIPEDDDWYRLDAYIDYLENEEEPSESSYTEERIVQQQMENVSEDSHSSEDDSQMEDVLDDALMLEEDNGREQQFNYVPMISISSSREFKARTKHIEVHNVDFAPNVPLFRRPDGFLVARFIINKWEQREYQGDIEFNHSRFTEENSYETLSFDGDEINIDEIWEMIEERLVVIMNCAARDRIITFIKLYEIYSTNHTVSITQCYRDFLRFNTVEVKVDLYSRLQGIGTVVFASRIYREAGTMTPLGEYPTIQSLKKKYRTFKWNKIVRNNQN